jgi:hypothetical protein
MKDGVMATFSLPRNIAVGPDNTVYVIYQLAESIEIFNAANIYTGSITGLSKPQDAAAQSIIDPDTGEVLEAKLYIIDQPVIQDGSTINDPQDDGTLNGSRIQVYDLLTGSLDEDHAFPSFGSDSDLGEYINPIGIGIDSQGYIYVSDSFLHVVFQYNPADTDTPVGSFTTGNVIDDSLSTPLGLTVSADGRLFVTSSFDGSVKIYGVDAIAGAGSWMNESPVADAGPDQTVGEDTTFVLDGSGSTDGDGILSYTWTQVDGSPVWETSSVTSDSPTVTVAANTVNVPPEGEILSFQLIVEDVYSKTSSPSTTNVTVNNVYTGSITINGGDTYTNNPNVTLTLDSDDADEMRFANDSDPFNGDYDGYAASKDWTLTDFDDSMEENEKFVRVEFKDAGGNLVVAQSSIFLDMKAPPVPTDLITGSSAGDLDWAPVPGATSYILQYASNSEFTDAVTVYPGVNGATISLDDFAFGTWYWRVQSVDHLGNASNWSDVGTFTVAPDCSAIVPETPLLAQPINTDPPQVVPRTTFLQTNPIIYAGECGTHLRTEWQVSENADFSTLVMHVGTTLDNLTIYQVPYLVLEPATTYYWRVRFEADNFQKSDWSAAWWFTTVDEPDVVDEDGVLYVQPEGDPDTSGEDIAIKKVIGDAGVKIRVIRVSSGVVAQTIKELDPDSIPDSVNKPDSFPLGLLSFKLTVEPAAFAQVEVSFSGAIPSDAEWYIYNVEQGWHAYAGAIFSGNKKSVTLNFQDGGIGDADGVANGIIVNP